MLNLNLLPLNEKSNLRYEFRTRAVMQVGWLIIWLLLISGVLMSPSLFFISFQATEVARALDLARQHEERSGMRGELAKIKELNSQAAFVAKHFESREASSAARLIEDIFKDVPQTALFQNIVLKRSASTMQIQGFSPTRPAFLAFLERMRANPRVESVVSPVSNVIRDTDINFSITLTLHPLP